MISRYYKLVWLARNVSNLLTALAFSALAAPAAAQTSALFPLDHFWTHALDAPFAAAPAASGARVYVPLQTGQLVALEPGRVEPAWSVALAADSAPVAAGDRLFVSASGAIHALDAATGSVVWRLPAGALAVPLTHRAGWLIVALADGGLQAVRAADGVVVWARAMGAPLTSAPAIDGNLLVAGFGDGRIALLDLATGNPRWQKSLGAAPGAITLSADRIFTGTADGYFWAIKTRDGDLDWRWRRGSRMIGAAAADPERVYVVALDNVVRAYSRSSGNEKWDYALSSRPLAGPMLVEGLVVITTGEMGAPGLVYINSITGAAAGKTPALPAAEGTTRVQFPVVMSTPPPMAAVPTGGASTEAVPMAAVPAAAGPTRAASSPAQPFALVATATTSGDWQLHAYRQTFLMPTPGPISWGPGYEIRRRLDYSLGAIRWGQTVTLSAPRPASPRLSRSVPPSTRNVAVSS